ncbi:MAG: AbrB/MazE/SpoVT family DNA-binding domain-containing protein [Betaproteobacteria bacterium]|jgi:antitoxin VapB|nr:AbrB/MazE/SpoVT family DNA-binding domain-containing protein [Betaproteobacteria bacterium]
MRRKARLFANGGSQAVRLPAEFRFDAQEVYIRRDEVTGDVILSVEPVRTWADFMALRGRLDGVPGDFMRERGQGTEVRDPFAATDA